MEALANRMWLPVEGEGRAPSLWRLSYCEDAFSLEAWLVQPRQYRHFARMRVVAKCVAQALAEVVKTV